MHLDDTGVIQRRIAILKMRGTNHSKVSHPYSIEKNGFTMSPERKDVKATSK